jgi:hypothetical protein
MWNKLSVKPKKSDDYLGLYKRRFSKNYYLEIVFWDSDVWKQGTGIDGVNTINGKLVRWMQKPKLPKDFSY